MCYPVMGRSEDQGGPDIMPQPSFYWGVGLENCWMAEHDEPNRSPKRLLDVFLQMQHYAVWREDLDKAADLGVTAIRYSVPWYKANPRRGVYDWAWITEALDYIVNHLNIVPVVDLIHYGTPLWMDNGVLNHAYPQHIADYAAAFARQFRGLVTHYTPHNEPQVGATYSGLTAYWPPYLTGIDGWLRVGRNIATGMVLTTEALRTELSDAVVISADCLASPHPDQVQAQLGGFVPEEVRADFAYQVRTFPASLAYGAVSPSGPFAAMLRDAGMPEPELAWFTTHAQAPDIVGHNFYPACFENTTGLDHGRLKAATDELEARLQQAALFFHRPTYLTETSAGHTDEQKRAWMHAAHEAITRLRARGIQVVGMNWWPLFETLQWDYRDTTRTVAESIRPGGWNNGLYLIEEQFDGTLARVPTGAVAAYRDLIAAASTR